MMHEKSEEILRALYKSATFVVQAIVFKETGRFVKHQKDLLSVVRPDEAAIVNTYLNLKNGGEVDFFAMSEVLFTFAKKLITEIG